MTNSTQGISCWARLFAASNTSSAATLADADTANDSSFISAFSRSCQPVSTNSTRAWGHPARPHLNRQELLMVDLDAGVIEEALPQAMTRRQSLPPKGNGIIRGETLPGLAGEPLELLAVDG